LCSESTSVAEADIPFNRNTLRYCCNYHRIKVLLYVYYSTIRYLELSELPQILAPNNDAFNKIPYTELNQAFSSNNQDVITNVVEYHILQGSRTAAELVPGNPVFIPTLLTNKAYSNVSGGQRVQNIKQSGNVVVFVSGQGSRSTLTQAVSVYTCPLSD